MLTKSNSIRFFLAFFALVLIFAYISKDNVVFGYVTPTATYGSGNVTPSATYSSGYVTPTATYSSDYVTPTATYSSGYVTPTATYVYEEDWLSCGYESCGSYAVYSYAPSYTYEPSYTYTPSYTYQPEYHEYHPACADQCSIVGQRECSGTGYRECYKGSDGCLHWGSVNSCGTNQTCINGSCSYFETCTDKCSVNGQRRCSGNGFQQCGYYGSSNCLDWGQLINCDSDKTCINGTCVYRSECDNECSVKDQRVCDGNGWKQCIKESDGCFHWSGINYCSSGQTCSNGSCNSQCANGCSTINQRVCDGNGWKQCVSDGSGCLRWGNVTPCSSGETCSNGSCSMTCSHECLIDGERVCDNNGWKQCGNFDSDPCLEWSNIHQCSSNEQCSQGKCEEKEEECEEPSVSAGSDKEVDDNESVRLDGSADGDYDSVHWTCTGGELSNRNILRPTWSVDSDYNCNYSDNYYWDHTRSYTCTLTATNECGSDSDSVRITVNRGYRPSCEPKTYSVITAPQIEIPYVSAPQPQIARFSITKMVRDVSMAGAYQASITANPADTVSYRIVVTGISGLVQPVLVRDAIPNGIFDIRGLSIDGMPSDGDIYSGINIGILAAGQTKTITYTATVAAESYLGYGQNALANTATVIVDGGSANSTAIVYVWRRAVKGAATVSTGFDSNLTAGLIASIAGIIFGFVWIFANRLTKTSANDPVAVLRQRIDMIRANGLSR